jgi:ribulose-5-phosphate 4-epimerase/fuculose-1-phosphate aldolase
MRGHGITTAAATIEDAALLAISLNELAVMNYEAALLGNPRPISLEDQETFRQVELVGRSDSQWRYYCRLTDADTL